MDIIAFWRGRIGWMSYKTPGNARAFSLGRGVCYLKIAIASLALHFVQPVLADEISETIISFDIQSQRADLALIEFAEQADRTLVFSYDITSRFTANTVKGRFSIIEGLGKLLEGTGLHISMDNEEQIRVVEQALADSDDSKPALASPDEATDHSLEERNEFERLASDDFTVLLEEILVTARKREELLHEIPTSAVVLNRQLLHDMGLLTDLRSLTDLVTGVSINDTNLAFISEPTIRGAGAGRNRMSVSATGLYRNGAYFATGGLGGKNFARMDNYDLQRAEVLRGPQGALYGRNALGGSINLITRKPQDELTVDLTLRAGQLDYLGLDAIINLPVNEKFAIRVSHVNEEQDKGNYSDVFGQPLDREKYRHSRISLRYQPSDQLEVNYVFDRQDQTTPPGIRVGSSFVPDLGSEFNTYANTLHEMQWDVDNHNLSIAWDLKSGVFTSITNLRDRFVSARQDGDFYTANPFQAREFLQQSDVSDIWFQELRYVSTGDDALQWLVGLDYFSSSNNDLIDLTLGDTWPGAQIRNTHLKQSSWAAFASIDYKLDKVPMTLSAEARYAVDDIDGSLVLYRFSDLSTPERDFTVRDSYTNLPFSGTVSWDFEQIDSLAYFKVASSYRQGGMNDGPGHPDALFDAGLSYDEESSVTWELGWKSTLLDRRLLLNFAGYYVFYKDFIAGTDNGCPDQCQLLDEEGTPLGFNPDGSRVGEDENGDPIPPNEEIPRTAFMDNVGDVEAWGMEAEASYRQPFPNSGGSLTFNLGWSRQMGDVKKLDEDVAEALLVRAGGARLQYMRPTQWKTQMVWRQPVRSLVGVKGFAGARFVASMNYVYEEGGVWDLNINNPNPMDTAKRLNARVGLQTDQWSLMLNGRNLTDEDYHIWHNSAVTVYRRIDPRYFFAEFTYLFRQ